MYGRLRVAAGVALLLAAVGLPAAAVIVVTMGRPAAANGASTLLYEGMQGPYQLVVRIIPARPVVPQTHFSMQVFDAAAAAVADADADARPLRDTEAQVTVAASGPPGAAAVSPRPALNDASLAYFEVDVPFDAVGMWQLRVTVASEDGREVFEIPLEVETARAGIQWLWIGIALAAILLAGLWTWLKVSRSGRVAAETEAES